MEFIIRTIQHRAFETQVTGVCCYISGADFIFGGIDHGETYHLTVTLDVFAYFFISFAAAALAGG
jgi:hypothetical protein